MALTKAIRRVAIVGTGVIGASWATHYLSRGFDVVATDPAPNAESDLRNFVDEAWATLASVGFGPGASAARLRFVPNLQDHAANRLEAALYKEVPYLVQQGVLSIADADVAVCYGPGIRWGVIGPSLQWHLGGGEGGIRHFAEHLMDSLVDLMKALEMPDITPALKQTLIDSVLQEAGHRRVDQLAKQENEVLLGLLALRDKVGIKGSGDIDWSRAA
jgi:3-hydroxyacyl-CoA dehydrogenase